MKVINLGAIRDPQERKWVQRIIELTEEGEMGWNFSGYIPGYKDDFVMHPILAEYGDLVFKSYDERGGGARFEIYEGGEEYPLVKLCHPAARVLRSFLVELAERDPEVRRQRLEKLWGIGISVARSAAERERSRRYVDKILGV